MIGTLQLKYLLPMEVADKRNGMFATKYVYDETTKPLQRYRVSGSVIFTGETHVVTLYRYAQAQVEGGWQALLSDSTLESRILGDIQRLLGKKEASAS